MKNKILSALFIVLMTLGMAQPLLGQPFTTPSAFNNKTDGTVVFAEDWNNTIGGLYTYITYTLLPQLNVLTAAGDIYYYSGSQLAKLPIGSTGQVLTVAGGLPSWSAGLGLPLTTKGDTLVYSGSANTRLPIGTNGKVLTADSTQTNGLAWESVANLQSYPGMIIMYNQTYGGNIPTGWVLCDGTNSTPNMIGMIPIGGQAASSSSASNPNGYGNTTYGNTYGSTLTNGNVTISGTTSNGANASSTINAGAQAAVSQTGHTHTFSGTGSFSTTNQPAGMSLVFIMKQ